MDDGLAVACERDGREISAVRVAPAERGRLLYRRMSHRVALALLSCSLLGLRHGFDYDHLAAITDIASVQRGWREGMRLGLLYALGHAVMITVLGGAVILFHLALPERLDAVGERLVGATLVAMAAYVLFSGVRAWRNGSGARGHSHSPVMRSRIAMMISGARYGWWRVRKAFGSHGPKPDPFAFTYDASSVFFVGVIHGLGAETPSQVLLFLLAAELGGAALGLVGLLMFVAGLLVMNTLMTASASGVFAGSRHRPRVQLAVTWLAAVYSLAMGAVFLFGRSSSLPALH